jgi:hypothetical protein
MKVRDHQNFWAGVMFVALGAFFAAFGAQHHIGSADRMGPGYFPTALGLIVIALGVILSFNSLSRKAPDVRVSRFGWKPLLLVLSPLVLFGVALRPLGLVPSVILLVLVSSMAGHQFSWRGALANAAVLAFICVAIFDWALDLHIGIWPAFFSH